MIGSAFPQTNEPMIKEPRADLDASNFERHGLGQHTGHNCIIVEVCGAHCKKHAAGLRRKEGAHQDTMNPPRLTQTVTALNSVSTSTSIKFGDMKWKRPRVTSIVTHGLSIV